jgi:hypothetical protein
LVPQLTGKAVALSSLRPGWGRQQWTAGDTGQFGVNSGQFAAPTTRGVMNTTISLR